MEYRVFLVRLTFLAIEQTVLHGQIRKVISGSLEATGLTFLHNVRYFSAFFTVVVALADFWKYSEGNWTWISGSKDTEPYSMGNYSIQGSSSPSNIPPGRYGPFSWIDSKDNLWMFGGEAVISNVRVSYGDLWKYDGTYWTWISGGINTPLFQISQGFEACINQPGARANGGGWIDSEDNLYLYGGWNGFAIGGLWKFNGNKWSLEVENDDFSPGSRYGFSTWTDSNDTLYFFGGMNYFGLQGDFWSWSGNWTLILANIGDVGGVYGEKGVPNAANHPGSRAYASSWIDSQDSLWLFGGNGFDESTALFGYLSDLWRYSGGNWTWISGLKVISQDASGFPSPRYQAFSFVDRYDMLWLFGGGPVLQNDLWTFNITGVSTSTPIIYPTSNITKVISPSEICTPSPSSANVTSFAFSGGTNSSDTLGSTGFKGQASATTIPSTFFSAAGWLDSNGSIWLFGGARVVIQDFANTPLGINNALWKFDGVEWAWISGANLTQEPTGDFDSQGIAVPGNTPSGRMSAFSWIDSHDNLWLFGGLQYDGTRLNDLWKFNGTYWNWVQSSSLLSYSDKGVSLCSNRPGKRSSGASFKDRGDNIYIFGGVGLALDSDYPGWSCVFVNQQVI